MITSLSPQLPPELVNMLGGLPQIFGSSHRFLILIERAEHDLIVWTSLQTGGTQADALAAANRLLKTSTTSGHKAFQTSVELAVSLGQSELCPVQIMAGKLTDALTLEHMKLPGLRDGQVLLLARSTAGADRHVALMEKLVAGMERAGEGFAITDPDGNFIYLNRSHVEMFGYQTSDEFVGKSWRMLYPPEEADRLGAEVFPELAAKGFWSGNAAAVRKDGSVFAEALTLVQMPDGSVTCNCQDRSQEVETMRRLERHEALFRKVTDNLPSGVFIRKPGESTFFKNRAAAKFLRRNGINATELLNATSWPTQVSSQLQEFSQIQLPDDGSVKTDLVWPGESDERTIELVKFRIPDLSDDGGETICTICTDVTERRMLENQLRKALDHKSEALSMQREFVSMISHEFRSPMAAIQGTSHLIERTLDGNLPGKMGRYLEIQNESLQTLGELVDQVLFLNRLETVVDEPDLRPTDIAEFLSTIVDYFNESSSEPRIELILPDEDLGHQPIDTVLLKAAVENLISNAIKYSARPKPVSVRLSRQGEFFEISVADLGRGIPAEEQDRLFQSFFRARNVGSVPGTGLGLRIAKRAVNYHRGEIEFRSTENEGSTFSIKIPTIKI